MSSQLNGTVSQSFIYLKENSVAENDPIKILFPKTMSFLLKKAKEFYGKKMKIQSFFDENGEQIKSIDMIIPGSIVYVSSAESNENELNNNQKASSAASQNSSKAAKSSNIKSKNSYHKLFGLPKGDQNRDENDSEQIKHEKSEFNDNSSVKSRESSQSAKKRENQSASKAKPNEPSKKKGSKSADAENHRKGKTDNSSRSHLPILKQNKRAQDQSSKKRSDSLDDEEIDPEDDYILSENDDENDPQKQELDQEEEQSFEMKKTVLSEINDENQMSNDNYSTRSRSDANSVHSRSDANSVHSRSDANSVHSRSDADSVHSRSDANSVHSRSDANSVHSRSDANSVHSRSDANSVQSQSHMSERASEKYYPKSSEFMEEEESPEEEVDITDLQNLFNEIFGQECTLQEKLPKALDDLPNYSSALRNLPSLEMEQKLNWYLHGIVVMEQQNFMPAPDTAYGIDCMAQHARQILQERRFITTIGVSHRLNLALVGPNQSGKSLFLRIFLEETLNELLTTDEYKKTFLFFVDLTTMMTYITDYSRFYLSIVSNAMNSISWQQPDLIPYIGMIQKKFEDVVIFKQPPKLTKTFMVSQSTQKVGAALQALIDKLSELWNNEEGLTEWTMMVLYFPILLSRALGFQKFLYVIDHYDIGDMIIDPSPSKFNESPSSVYLINILNYVLTQTNFIIACNDQQNFFNIIDPGFDERESQKDFTMISTINIIQEPSYSDKQINIDTDKERTPIVLTASACGGVPRYVELWDKINKMYDKLDDHNEEENENEPNNEEEDDFDDLQEILKDELFSLAQKAIKLLFIGDDSTSKFEITDIRRKDIPNKDEKNA